METLYSLNLAVILGGMVTFQILFAPLVFIKLENQVARKFIRSFFPYYYVYFATLSGCALLLALWRPDSPPKGILLVCLLGFLVSRQWLMPIANTASDSGNKRRFTQVHNATVTINTLQMFAFAYLLV